MIEKLLRDAQERFWSFCSMQAQVVSELATAEIIDLRHRAEELSSHQDASWRATAEVVKSACDLELEKRK